MKSELCRLLLELNKYSCCVSIENWNTDTLACNLNIISWYDYSILDLAPNSKRLLLRLLFLA